MTPLDFKDIRNKQKKLTDIPQEYIKYMEELVDNSKYYPTFHIAPKYGLMNDPNGLIEIDGWYHIFYQWFPLGPVHGLKHWYHVKTRDFLHYMDMGIGMCPDADLDISGCFSGMIVKDEAHQVYYTGVGNGNEQNVCRAIFDDQEKIVNKEIVVKVDRNITTHNFRDPFVFRKNGIEYMIVGAELVTGEGAFILYEKDGAGFVSRGPLNIGNVDLGYMLECPNLISIDKKELLIFSPQGIASPDKYTYRNVFSVAYGIGAFNPEMNQFECNEFMEIDKGFDFYAPQLFKDSKNRCIMLAWLGNSKCVYPSDYEQWAHMMTIPREVTIENKQLKQWPIKEMEELRYESIAIEEEICLANQSFELELEVNEEFLISIENEWEESVSFLGFKDEYMLDRSQMSELYNEEYGNIRYAKRDMNCPKKDSEKIRIYIDHSAIEIFANDGKVTFTARFYLKEFNRIKLRNCKGTIHYLKAIEMNTTEMKPIK